MLQPYLIFQSLSILYRFPDHLFHFFTIYFAIFRHGSQYLTSTTVVTNRYRTSASPKFRQLFFSFQKCEITPHRLYCDSLTLLRSLFKTLVTAIGNHFLWFFNCSFLSVEAVFPCSRNVFLFEFSICASGNRFSI